MMRRDDDPKTRFEVVLLQLREMILNGELPPGGRVQEIAISKRLGVSRTPVRNSLAVLEQEGLVRGEPNRGFTVREFTVSEILAAYDIRSVLEGYGCRIVAEHGLTDGQDRALGDCIALGARLLAAGFFDATTIRPWTEMNGRFHAAIVEASGNPSLAASLHLVNQHPLTAPNAIAFRTGNLERLFHHMQRAQEQHEAVLTALRRRQAVRAERLMAEHIFISRENLHDEIRAQGLDMPDPLQRFLDRALAPGTDRRVVATRQKGPG
ncbi:GntR family transcriptional regulator [Muricoccus aerilatus]|uniref:GntR family transcriptional regulator n=1 Tax=Muricoccus aerilatus TaxID=452982 RepID=UPI0012EC0F63|nr:GntR family transcriptional regulator [Roseomonas aerilata]